MNSIVAFFVTFGVMSATHSEPPKPPEPPAKVAAAPAAEKIHNARLRRHERTRERIALTNAWLKAMRKPHIKQAVVVAER